MQYTYETIIASVCTANAIMALDPRLRCSVTYVLSTIQYKNIVDMAQMHRLHDNKNSKDPISRMLNSCENI